MSSQSSSTLTILNPPPITEYHEVYDRIQGVEDLPDGILGIVRKAEWLAKNNITGFIYYHRHQKPVDGYPVVIQALSYTFDAQGRLRVETPMHNVYFVEIIQVSENSKLTVGYDANR